MPGSPGRCSSPSLPVLNPSTLTRPHFDCTLQSMIMPPIQPPASSPSSTPCAVTCNEQRVLGAQLRSCGAVALDALWTWAPHRSHIRCPNLTRHLNCYPHSTISGRRQRRTRARAWGLTGTGVIVTTTPKVKLISPPLLLCWLWFLLVCTCNGCLAMKVLGKNCSASVQHTLTRS